MPSCCSPPLRPQRLPSVFCGYLSWLHKLPSGYDALLPFNGNTTIRLRLPVFEYYRDSVRLFRIGCVHNVEMKMRFGRITRVADFAERVSRFHNCSDSNGDTARLQMGVIAKLAVPVVDNDDVAARRVEARITGIVVRDIRAHVNHGAIPGGQHFLAEGIVRA